MIPRETKLINLKENLPFLSRIFTRGLLEKQVELEILEDMILEVTYTKYRTKTRNNKVEGKRLRLHFQVQ